MNFDASAAYPWFGHLSPKTQPLTQSIAQFILFSTVLSSVYFQHRQLAVFQDRLQKSRFPESDLLKFY